MDIPDVTGAPTMGTAGILVHATRLALGTLDNDQRHAVARYLNGALHEVDRAVDRLGELAVTRPGVRGPHDVRSTGSSPQHDPQPEGRQLTTARKTSRHGRPRRSAT